VCDASEPPVVEVSLGHSIRCHIPPAELKALQSQT
jgi:hypothetical protein